MLLTFSKTELSDCFEDKLVGIALYNTLHPEGEFNSLEEHKAKIRKIIPEKDIIVEYPSDQYRKVYGFSSAGLSKTDSRFLYLRKPALDLLEHLNNNRFSRIEGPPGTGKSSITWLWACQQASSKSLLWIHLDSIQTNGVCVELKNLKVSRFSAADVPSVISACTNDVMLLDGLTNNNSYNLLGRLSAWFQENQNRKAIIISSLPLSIKSQDLMTFDIQTFLMPSWSLLEYRSAILDKDFYTSIQHFLDVFKIKDEDQKIDEDQVEFEKPNTPTGIHHAEE
eukprot:TRINITY_DN2593_c0_g1_i4.p1 TRINITY_DN2593_c0_g1~~TRINITY_DN2593_c0_g1_i4.p1  ORF type:complete len:330 (-),score=40.15 TRINITY_DN2593_c0_g1_i4:1096-1938(-)